MIFAKEMHLDVLRRAMELKYDEIEALTIRMHECIGDVNWTLRSKPLPDLPFEVIRRIFSFLYPIERLDTNEERQTTLRRFVEDPETSDGWKEVIRRDIPVLFTDVPTHRYFPIREHTHHIVGPHPTLLPVNRGLEAGEGRPDISQGTQVSMLLGAHPPDEHLQSLISSNTFEWHNLFINSSSRDDDFTPDILDNCRSILPNLQRLEVSQNSFTSLTHQEAVDKARRLQRLQLVERGADDSISPWRLRFAKIPFPLLPVLHSAMAELTHLDLTLSENIIDLKEVLDGLNDLPSHVFHLSLENQTPLWIPSEPERFADVSDSHHYPVAILPNVKSLKMHEFSGNVARTLIKSLDCPSLESFSCSQLRYRESSQDRNTLRVPMSLLHSRYPGLKELHVSFDEILVRDLYCILWKGVDLKIIREM